jgi:hypothetical protein
MSHAPKQPPRESVRPEEQPAYDRVVAQQAAYGYATSGPGYEAARPPDQLAGPFYSPLLQSPIIAEHLSDLAVFYRTRGELPGSYSHVDREWIDAVLGRELGLNMWGHIADGLAVGVRPEAMVALFEAREADLTDDERMFAEYIRAVARGQATPEQYQAIERKLGTRGAVEYTAFIAHLTMVIRLIQVFTGTAGRLSDAEILQRVREVIDGTRELPDPRARIPSLEPAAA